MMDDAPAEVSETHVSTVFFVGDRAYKLKKPVRFGFLDFSTRPRRREACEREVELNRRLSPDDYLGVADVVGPDGAVCDHLVVMRRLPADRRLATIVKTQAAVKAEVRKVARVVAAFHAAAPRGDEISRAATRDAVLANWSGNFDEMAPFVGSIASRAAEEESEYLVRRYLEGRDALFEARIADGHVCDGHGDLTAADIFCLDDGPHILDCIEFDDRLRYGDVLNDIGFLAMDLERLDRPDLALRLLSWYREFSGSRQPQSLIDHYVAYRAHVRAKVACLRHAQGDPRAAAAVHPLQNLAVRHLRAGRVALVLVGGPPASGKSTVARIVAAQTGWMTMSSDEVRKELAGVSHHTPAGDRFEEGIYRPEASDATYTALLDRARRLLSLGESVIVDASFRRAEWRRAAARVAAETATELVQLRCRAPVDVAVGRLAGRSGPQASDATPAIARRLASVAEEWPGAIDIDTSCAPADTVAAAMRAVRSIRRAEDVAGMEVPIARAGAARAAV